MSHGFRDDAHGFGPAPPPRSSKLPIILALVGVAGLVGLLLCCGAGVWLARFGMNVVSADIEAQLRDHPQILQHLGVIQEFKVNWSKSLAEDDDDIWTYDVEGTKATGELIVESVSEDDGEVIVSATLRLSTGEVIDLAIE